MRALRSAAAISFACGLSAPPAAAQQAPAAPVVAPPDELDAAPVQAPPAPDALALARAAAQRGDAAEALSRYLRVLASQPDNVEALAGAGRAALDVGDVNAATGFFARAEGRDARNGPVKAGLASAVLQSGDVRTALRFFREAVELGVPAAAIAADRGLAYDLRGDMRRAQADYQLALRTHASDETTRRLAVSQAISGDRAAALLLTLDPLLRRRDLAAWRTRAFVRAMTGDVAGASEDANLILPQAQAQALQPYFVRLAQLKPAEKAAAVDLGRFPAIGAKAPQPRLAFDQAVAVGPSTSDAMRAPRAEADAAALAANARPAAGAPPKRASRAIRAPTPPVAAPRRGPRAQALAAARTKREKVASAAAEKRARGNPARHWVQVAGGANRHDLGRAWADLKKKWPSQLSGRSPWTTHYRFTNRLLIGPFPSSDGAQDWVSARKKEGFATFRVETGAGDPVERVKG